MDQTHDAGVKMVRTGPQSWYSWKSPVGLGIFLVTAAIALFVLLNLIVSISSALHPADSSPSEQQIEQELEQSAPAQTSATPTTGATSAAAQ